MPTTIQLALSTDMTSDLTTTKPKRFYARTDFTILMLWALTMLSVSAAAQFGTQPSELNTFEIIMPF
jgi:hypothetical protein